MCLPPFWLKSNLNTPNEIQPRANQELMKQVIGGLFPELAEIGFTDSRVCQFPGSQKPVANIYQSCVGTLTALITR